MNRGKRGAEKEGKRLSMEAGLGVLSRKTGACDVGKAFMGRSKNTSMLKIICDHVYEDKIVWHLSFF